ncbi:hypothetical protein MN116_007030 [Schistosoma mekongi]|uniref:Complex I-B12 n=1 Tax=Schistosoma mekongi TaxID=38744 RepID=A0AAE1Z963_SCHME|nr:hypothetical protein MN116_007030 [Schistosoma mekongi]
MKTDWKCPDWKSYTLDHPALQEHVKNLAKLGLKDPWIRNYAWRYSPKIYKSRPEWFRVIFSKRLPHGIFLGIVVSICVNKFDQWRKGEFSLRWL